MPGKVAVIGAGIGGIAVAARLAVKGYQVAVFEKNDRPGGKMSEIRHEGFRFDTGPSLFTLPGFLEEIYSLAGEKFTDHFTFSKLDEVCRYFFEDGMIIRAYSNASDFANELNVKAGEDVAEINAYLAESRNIYEFTEPVFIRNSLHLAKNYFTKDFFRATFLLHKLKPFASLHAINSKFFSHPNTVQLFDRFATYNGSDPYKAPATLMVIPHLEHNLGAFFPSGGMFDIAKSLFSLCERLGVKFHFNRTVDEIIVEKGKVQGIRFDGGDYFESDTRALLFRPHFLLGDGG
jgi:phytoene desaturase